MRPSVSEQLRETHRILNDVIAPHLADKYAIQILDKLTSNLKTLEACWQNVVSFLNWDNQAASALLNTLREQVGTELREAIAKADSVTSGDSFDVASLQDRN